MVKELWKSLYTPSRQFSKEGRDISNHLEKCFPTTERIDPLLLPGECEWKKKENVVWKKFPGHSDIYSLGRKPLLDLASNKQIQKSEKC